MRSLIFRMLLAVWLPVAGMVVLAPEPAWAQGIFGPGNKIATCLTEVKLKDRIIGKIAFCFREMVVPATEEYVEEVTDYLGGAIGALFVLAVTLYGVRISIQDYRYLTPETMVLLLKIAVISYFAFNMEDWVPTVFGITDQFVGFIMDFVNRGSGPLSNFGGFCQRLPDDYRFGSDMRVWDAMDCYVGRITGYGPKYTFKSSIVGLLFPLLMTGGPGIVACFMGLLACWMLLSFICSALFYVLGAYITLAIMMIFAPLLFPLLIFKRTYKYFKAWLDTLVSGMFTPMFAIGFLVFFIAVLDAILFEGMEYGGTTYITLDKVFTPKGEKTVKGADTSVNMAKVIRTNQSAFSLVTPTDPKKKEVGEGAKALLALTRMDVISAGAHVSNWFVGQAMDAAKMVFSYSVLDFSAIDDTPGATEMRIRSLTYILVALFMVAAAGKSMMKTIPSMVSSMTSGGSAIMAMGMEGLLGGNMLGRGIQTAKQGKSKLQDALSGTSSSLGQQLGEH